MSLQEKSDKPALPEKWITPIRLLVYLVLAGCSAYIYFNSRELEFTHYIIFVSVAAVAGMVLLDCKMSAQYWQKQNKENLDS